MLLKRNTKKTPFCISSKKLFLKYGLHEINWVGHSVMKPVGAVAFKKIKSLREVNNDKIINFDMDILDEGVLDESLEGPEKL